MFDQQVSYRGEFMKIDQKHKLYMGFAGFRMKIPYIISNIGLKKGAKGAKENAALLSKEERHVHHFIVKKMAVVKNPITAELITSELGISNDRVNEILYKLESLKTFIYRSNGKGINWAYPLSLEDTSFKMTASSGEHFFAA